MISDLDVKVIYTAGTTLPLNFDHKDNSSIQVYLRDSSDVITTLVNTEDFNAHLDSNGYWDYLVLDTTTPTSAFYPDGIPSGASVLITRNTSKIQGRTIKDSVTTYALGTATENALDDVVRSIQEIGEDLSHCLKADRFSTSELQLPTPTQDMYIGWNSDGTAIENKSPPVDNAVLRSEIDVIDDRLDSLESDVSTLQGDVSTAQGDITTLKTAHIAKYTSGAATSIPYSTDYTKLPFATVERNSSNGYFTIDLTDNWKATIVKPGWYYISAAITYANNSWASTGTANLLIVNNSEDPTNAIVDTWGAGNDAGVKRVALKGSRYLYLAANDVITIHTQQTNDAGSTNTPLLAYCNHVVIEYRGE